MENRLRRANPGKRKTDGGKQNNRTHETARSADDEDAMPACEKKGRSRYGGGRGRKKERDGAKQSARQCASGVHHRAALWAADGRGSVAGGCWAGCRQKANPSRYQAPFHCNTCTACAHLPSSALTPYRIVYVVRILELHREASTLSWNARPLCPTTKSAVAGCYPLPWPVQRLSPRLNNGLLQYLLCTHTTLIRMDHCVSFCGKRSMPATTRKHLDTHILLVRIRCIRQRC
jgi:hypothetical protein